MEAFFTGYCRCLDRSRIVTVEDEDCKVFIDCSYENCPYRSDCEVGREITKLLENNGEAEK